MIFLLVGDFDGWPKCDYAAYAAMHGWWFPPFIGKYRGCDGAGCGDFIGMSPYEPTGYGDGDGKYGSPTNTTGGGQGNRCVGEIPEGIGYGTNDSMFGDGSG